MSVTVRIKRVRADASLPTLGSSGAAAWDVRACLTHASEKRLDPWITIYDEVGVRGAAKEAGDLSFIIPPMGRALVPTGLAFAFTDDYRLEVLPRSGISWEHGVLVANSPGTLDSDYRGELRIILLNASTEPFTVRHGDRIAQILLTRVEKPDWLSVDDLEESQRGEGGFGSTGRA